MGIEWAAGKISLANLDGGHFPASLVDLHDQVFGVGLLVNINFREVHAAVPKELFGAAAIDAPTRAVHCDFFHIGSLDVTASRGIRREVGTLSDPKRQHQPARPILRPLAGESPPVAKPLPR